MKPNLDQASELATDGACAQGSPLAQAIAAFASATNLRSASVDELVSDDFHRRPARPEDWSFLALEPVKLDAASRLINLACNRLLCAINDRTQLHPLPLEHAGWAAYLEHHDPALSLAAARLKPALERLVFAELMQRAEHAPTLDAQRLRDALEQRLGAEQRAREVLEAAGEATRPMLARFDLLQLHAVLAQRCAALRLARASGPFVEAVLPRSLLDSLAGAASARCGELGLRTGLHAHWQFYLPTTLMNANHLWSLREGARVYELLGATTFAELHALAFARVHRLAAHDELAAFEQLQARLSWLRTQFGAGAYQLVERGFEQARQLQRVADRDRLEQLIWLRDLEAYSRLAYAVDERIRREQIEIDRETFVEPREMCSTTHVHDDHRLVSIESGAMIFWGMPGMELALAPGEMTLVPCGRLHGSTVTSSECVYHQPIIPESWIASDLPGARIRESSAVARELA